MDFFCIDNGINLKVVQTDKFKTNALTILIRQKLNYKTTTFNALIANILTIGCYKYPSIKDISLKTEQLFGTTFYSEIIKKGENQIIEFFVEFVKDKVELEDVFIFLCEVVLNPLVENDAFKKEYFEKAKQNVIDNIKAIANNKKEYAKFRCVEQMCKNEDFSICADGYIEDFDKYNINEKNLFEYYKNLITTSEIDFIFVGNVSTQNIKNAITKNFKIKNRNFEPIKIDFFEKKQHDTQIVNEQMNISQGKLCLGFRTNISFNNDLFFALLVGNEILGGGPASKLFLNVREKQSLCYYVSSFVYIFKGIILVEAGINFLDYQKTIDCIKNEIQNMVNKNFSMLEFENAINSLKNKILSSLDYNTSIMDHYLTQFLLNSNYSILEFFKKIENVKQDDICKVFKNIWLDTIYFLRGEKND